MEPTMACCTPGTRFALLSAVCAALLLMPASASAQRSVIGGGVVYTDLEPFDVGLQLNGYLAMPAVTGLSIGGDLTYYVPPSYSQQMGGTKMESDGDLLAFNANLRYRFAAAAPLHVYALSGLNVARWSVSASELGTATELGLNLGGGLELGIGFGRLYGEAKLVTGELDRFVIAAGIRLLLR
jgi:hypothetical protein